jgi:hypothetical protein
MIIALICAKVTNYASDRSLNACCVCLFWAPTQNSVPLKLLIHTEFYATNLEFKHNNSTTNLYNDWKFCTVQQTLYSRGILYHKPNIHTLFCSTYLSLTKTDDAPQRLQHTETYTTNLLSLQICTTYPTQKKTSHHKSTILMEFHPVVIIPQIILQRKPHTVLYTAFCLKNRRFTHNSAP